MKKLPLQAKEILVDFVINNAITEINNRLEITDWDHASMFFHGDDKNDIYRVMLEYINHVEESDELFQLENRLMEQFIGRGEGNENDYRSIIHMVYKVINDNGFDRNVNTVETIFWDQVDYFQYYRG
jgi:hypothetical protein